MCWPKNVREILWKIERERERERENEYVCVRERERVCVGGRRVDVFVHLS